jgi:hypothetical protein
VKSRDAAVFLVEKTMTISDRVRATVDEAAERTAWQPLMESWGRDTSRQEILSKVRVGLWRTPEGQALRDLDRAAGSKPYSPKAVAEIRKSKDAARFAKALEVLEHGFPLR